MRCRQDGFAMIAEYAYIDGMTPQELTEFRTRMGWSQAELGRRLELSPSRLADYEAGFTRGQERRPATIPKSSRDRTMSGSLSCAVSQSAMR